MTIFYKWCLVTLNRAIRRLFLVMLLGGMRLHCILLAAVFSFNTGPVSKSVVPISHDTKPQGNLVQTEK